MSFLIQTLSRPLIINILINDRMWFLIQTLFRPLIIDMLINDRMGFLIQTLYRDKTHHSLYEKHYGEINLVHNLWE